MFPIQRLRGSSSAEILGVFALVVAIAVPVLAVVQIANDGAAATVARAAWWFRFGIVETASVIVLAAIWIRRRSHGAR